MSAGRPRLPTRLKLIKGTLRPERENLAEPMPKAGIPEMPADLSPGAKRAWKKFATLLDELGVLTRVDGAALGCLCEATADLEAARKSLRARGGALVYMNDTAAGGVTYRAFPELKLIAEADHRLQGWLSRFGLTPTDRAKVSSVDKGPPDPNGKFFR